MHVNPKEVYTHKFTHVHTHAHTHNTHTHTHTHTHARTHTHHAGDRILRNGRGLEVKIF